jgi:hypothetical protein
MRIAIPLLLLTAGLAGCESAKTFTTTVELVDVEHYGEAPEQASQVTFEMRYADCPGDNRRILRGDRQLAQCTKELREGAKVPIEISSKWSSERGGYRSEVTKIGGCAVKQDPKDEANYEMTSVCTDVKASGTVVGVHCDRSRPKDLIAKCPFLRRN